MGGEHDMGVGSLRTRWMRSTRRCPVLLAEGGDERAGFGDGLGAAGDVFFQAPEHRGLELGGDLGAVLAEGLGTSPLMATKRPPSDTESRVGIR